MTTETAYKLYSDYVACIHDALSKPPTGPIADAYRVRRLSRSEFEAVWQYWGHIPSWQDRWAARFSAGYKAAVSFRRGFDVALAKRDTDREAA